MTVEAPGDCGAAWLFTQLVDVAMKRALERKALGKGWASASGVVVDFGGDLGLRVPGQPDALFNGCPVEVKCFRCVCWR